jgi:hypothetical protein
MFCPQCKAEYRVGFVRCSACDVELVDQLLPADPPPQLGFDGPDSGLVVVRRYVNRFDADLAKTALEGLGIDSMIRSDISEIEYSLALIVRSGDVKDADEILGVDDNNGEPA